MGLPAEIKSQNVITGLKRRTVVGLLRAWRGIKGRARYSITGTVRPNLPREDEGFLLNQMRECLDETGGDLTARFRTAELGKTYLGLNESGKMKFLKLLAEEFDIDRGQLEQLLQEYAITRVTVDRIRQEQIMRELLVAPRSRILKQFTALPDGFKFLVDMRADVTAHSSKDGALQALEYDLRNILSSWFDIGMLDLTRITWDSPASLLEKLIEYEAVHRIASWDDLKNRLDTDRRVFAFLHPKMPREPLIFVQVALVKGMADSIQALLDETSPLVEAEEADSAIFYSISNAQKGLAGISFGNFLIKRVVDSLSREMPHIKTFATLSPIPGFRAWLGNALQKGGQEILMPVEIKTIADLTQSDSAEKGLLDLLESEWHKEPARAETLKPILLRLCARYLVQEKKKGKAPDPVAQFHLFNGARMERLNWLADTSAKGMKQSGGMMVNYNYVLDDIDNNHEAYANEGEVVASKTIKVLLK